MFSPCFQALPSHTVSQLMMPAYFQSSILGSVYSSFIFSLDLHCVHLLTSGFPQHFIIPQTLSFEILSSLPQCYSKVLRKRGDLFIFKCSVLQSQPLAYRAPGNMRMPTPANLDLSYNHQAGWSQIKALYIPGLHLTKASQTVCSTKVDSFHSCTK